MSSPEASPVVVSTARGDIEYAELGPENGPALLVVHGTPGGFDQAVAMGRSCADAGFRVLAPSRPGYGRTPLASGRTPAEQADLLAALLDHHGLDQVGLLCWSGGGPSAYRFAVRHRDRLRALVAVAAVSGPFDFRPETPTDRFLLGTGAGRTLLASAARRAPKRLIAATLASEGNLTRSQLREQTTLVAESQSRRAFVLALAVTANRSGNRREGYANDSRQMAVFDSADLAQIQAPTMLVHGLSDSDVSIVHSRTAAGLIPGAELVELDAGTHLAFWADLEAPAVQERAFALLRTGAR